MEAYDHRALDASAKEIVDHAKRTNARVCGPIPMRRGSSGIRCCEARISTRNRASSSRCARTSAWIDIFEPTARTIEALNRLVVPAGVFVKIKA
jgi:small subunit ribosomal protein S10